MPRHPPRTIPSAYCRHCGHPHIACVCRLSVWPRLAALAWVDPRGAATAWRRICIRGPRRALFAAAVAIATTASLWIAAAWCVVRVERVGLGWELAWGALAAILGAFASLTVLGIMGAVRPPDSNDHR